jgi:excisionase family DNA binding protein
MLRSLAENVKDRPKMPEYAYDCPTMALALLTDLPKVIAVEEAAERLNVHERTIRRWIKQGRLKPYRVMGDVRRFVAVDEVEALREPIPVEIPVTKAETKPRARRQKKPNR